ncbi:helix-turn-helix domain-containing protein [Cryobacterium sp. TMS1-20-1]|nr:helix-turn-helix domain-containing protein [Cryobacterium sp. TMS1-20-1]
MSRIEPVDPCVRLAIVHWPPDAPRGAVSTFCAEHHISQETFYAIRKRAATDGPAAALEPRSRRPKASPSKLTDTIALEAYLVEEDDRLLVFDSHGTLLIEHRWPLPGTKYVGSGRPRGPRGPRTLP